MSPSHGREQLPDDLREVVHALFDGRATLDPLGLDRVKLQAMHGARRSTSSRGKGFFARSRLTTAVAVGFLSLGTGGALAIAGGGNHGKHEGHNASFSQYRPGCGFGDKNHIHTGPPGRPPGFCEQKRGP
jgi:hypothetical protein